MIGNAVSSRGLVRAAAITLNTAGTARAGSDSPPGRAATVVAATAVAMALDTTVAMAVGADGAAGTEWLLATYLYDLEISLFCLFFNR
jgi:hypothetical protein